MGVKEISMHFARRGGAKGPKLKPLMENRLSLYRRGDHLTLGR